MPPDLPPRNPLASRYHYYYGLYASGRVLDNSKKRLDVLRRLPQPYCLEDVVCQYGDFPFPPPYQLVGEVNDEGGELDLGNSQRLSRG